MLSLQQSLMLKAENQRNISILSFYGHKITNKKEMGKLQTGF